MKLLSLVGLSLLSTLAGATREECFETLQGDDLKGFFDGIEEAEFEDIPALCKSSGGDFISYSGPITCENVEDVIEIEDQFHCFPPVCTDSEDLLEIIIVDINKPEGSDRNQCSGSFEYEGLGESIHQPMRCGLDFVAVADQVWNNFYDAIKDDLVVVYHNEDCWEYLGPDVGDDVGEISSECIIKYTNAERVCEENDGMDYFLYSRSSTLSDGTIDKETDNPSCFPSSCTSDEEVLKSLLLPEGPENDEDEHSFEFTDIGPSCKDPPNEVKFDFLINDKPATKNCVWARNNSKKRCKYPEIKEGCPMTCGGCDSTEMFFLLDGSSDQKSCEWAAKKKTSKRCNKPPTSEMCPSVCQSWPE